VRTVQRLAVHTARVNTGVAYERLIEGVVAAIGAAAGVQTLELRTRARIAGATMTHEVDVWWRFRAGDRDRSVWISCKDWANPVGNGALWEFVGKLDDIRPRPHGVFVVRRRLQASALKVARAHGITAWEVREPTDEDWEGRLHTINTTLVLSAPEQQIEVHVPVDSDHGSEEHGLTAPRQVQVLDQRGRPSGRLADLIRELTATAPPGMATDWEERRRDFDPSITLVHEDGRRQLVAALIVRTRWHTMRREIRVGGPETISLIIRDALTDDMSIVQQGQRARLDPVSGQLLGQDSSE
jgi:hypothetical protein